MVVPRALEHVPIVRDSFRLEGSGRSHAHAQSSRGHQAKDSRCQEQNWEQCLKPKQTSSKKSIGNYRLVGRQYPRLRKHFCKDNCAILVWPRVAFCQLPLQSEPARRPPWWAATLPFLTRWSKQFAGPSVPHLSPDEPIIEATRYNVQGWDFWGLVHHAVQLSKVWALQEFNKERKEAKLK